MHDWQEGIPSLAGMRESRASRAERASEREAQRQKQSQSVLGRLVKIVFHVVLVNSRR